MLVEIPCCNTDEVIRVIRKRTIELSKERYFIAGPCGIGKTSLGRVLSRELKLHFIDHDEMKEKVKQYPFPCSVTNLNLDDCLRESLIVEGNPSAFIFVVGGDSIFRVSADNNERLAQLRQAREKYGLAVVVLTAEKAILENRYLQVGVRNKENFSGVWKNWEDVEKPYWEKCADCMIETSKLVLSHES